MKAFWSVACPSVIIQRFVTHWREIARVACAKVICVPRLLFFARQMHYARYDASRSWRRRDFPFSATAVALLSAAAKPLQP